MNRQQHDDGGQLSGRCRLLTANSRVGGDVVDVRCSLGTRRRARAVGADEGSSGGGGGGLTAIGAKLRDERAVV